MDRILCLGEKMPGVTKPRYLPNRGTPDWNAGTEMEKELFLRFCEANPQLICRSLAETTPVVSAVSSYLIPDHVGDIQGLKNGKK